MANIKSQKKDLRRNAKRKVINTGIRSALKTFIKKAKTTATPDSVASAVKALDKAVQKGVVHKNQAARKKSRLMIAANKVNSAAK